MTKNRDLQNQLDRIRREEDALIIIAIKPECGFVSADPKLAPKGAAELISDEIPRITQYLQQQRSSAAKQPAQKRTVRQQQGEAFYDMAWARYTANENLTDLETQCLKEEGLL